MSSSSPLLASTHAAVTSALSTNELLTLHLALQRFRFPPAATAAATVTTVATSRAQQKRLARQQAAADQLARAHRGEGTSEGHVDADPRREEPVAEVPATKPVEVELPVPSSVATPIAEVEESKPAEDQPYSPIVEKGSLWRGVKAGMSQRSLSVSDSPMAPPTTEDAPKSAAPPQQQPSVQALAMPTARYLAPPSLSAALSASSSPSTSPGQSRSASPMPLGALPSPRAVQSALDTFRMEPKEIAAHGWMGKEANAPADEGPDAREADACEAEVRRLASNTDSLPALLRDPIRASFMLRYYSRHLKPVQQSARRMEMAALGQTVFGMVAAKKRAARNLISAAAHRATQSLPTVPPSAAPAPAPPLPVPDKQVPGHEWFSGGRTTSAEAILNYLKHLEGVETGPVTHTPVQQPIPSPSPSPSASSSAVPSPAASPSPKSTIAQPTAAASHEDDDDWHASESDESAEGDDDDGAAASMKGVDAEEVVAEFASESPSSSSPMSTPRPGYFSPRGSEMVAATAAAPAPSVFEIPFLPFAPSSPQTRAHLLLALELREFALVWEAFAQAATNTEQAAAAAASTQVGRSPTPSPSPSRLVTTLTFTVGRGAKSLAAQLVRIRERYLQPTTGGSSKVDLGFAPSLLSPILSAIDDFVACVSSQKPAALSALIFAGLSPLLLKRLEIVCWDDYRSSAHEDEWSYLSGLRASRTRVLQRECKLLARQQRDARQQMVERMWKENLAVHGTVFSTEATPAASSASSSTGTTGAAAGHISFSSKDQLSLAKLMHSPFTIPYVKSFLAAVQQKEEQFWLKAKEKLDSQPPAADETEGDWSIDDAPATAPTAAAAVALPLRRYPHTCFLFWQECVSFKRCPRSEYRRTWAKKLLHNYVAGGSSSSSEKAKSTGGVGGGVSAGPDGLSLGNRLKRCIAWACQDEPPALTFDAAKEHAFTVICSYLPLFDSYPPHGDMMRKIAAHNTKFIETLDEHLRGLFLSSSAVDFQRDPTALLASPDDLTYPTFEDCLSGTGLIYLQHFLEDQEAAGEDFPLLLVWLDIQEFQKIPPQHTTLDYMSRQANKLYDMYVRQGAPDQVPLPKDVLRALIFALESHLSPLAFNACQAWVEELLRDEVYTRFLSSEACASLRRDVLQEQSKAANGAAGGGAAGGGGVGANSGSEDAVREKQQKLAQLRQAQRGRTHSNPLAPPHGSSNMSPRHARGGSMSIASTFGNSAPVLLFTDLLKDPMLLGLFKEYLQSNFALESLLFYLEVQQYKLMPQSDFMQTIASKMYAKYVKPGAKMNITYLDQPTRETIANGLAPREATNTNNTQTTTAGGVKANSNPAGSPVAGKVGTPVGLPGAGAKSAGAPPVVAKAINSSVTNGLFASAESCVHQYLAVQKFSEFLQSRQFAEIPLEHLRAVVEQQQRVEREETLQEQLQLEAARERRGSFDADHEQSPSQSTGRLSSAELRERMTMMWEHVTLELILGDPLATARFKQFCHRHACSENLYFYLACQEFRYIPSSAYLRVVASKIYATYIVKAARMEVNLPGHIYKEIECGLATPTKKLFQSAQEVIFRLMNTSSFPKFLASHEYRAYFEDLAKAAEPQSKWSIAKLFSSNAPAPMLPPVGTTIAAVPSRTRGMSLSFADGKGGQRTSLFPTSSTDSKPRLGRPTSAGGHRLQPQARSASPAGHREYPPLPPIPD